MTSFVLEDATTWVNGYDFTGDTNQVSLSATAEELDATPFGVGFRVRRTGLRTVTAQLNGFWQSALSGAVDPEAFPDLGVADRVVTLAPDLAEGSTAYLFQGGKFSYQAFGQVGAMTPFSLGMSGTNGVGLIRGQVAKAKADVSAVGATGTGVQLGAVGVGQYLYASLHVFAAGTTITVDVESAPDDTFAAATSRGTIGPVTTAGGVWMARVVGPITDAYYRFNVTAVTGTFSIAGAIGIGS